ncbi:MAG: hypothetical protein HY912_02575 [Desulfomonile tiedjei]|uniref:Uncharacterized protein n=1 Tax=Desulfomonile tiedjei TaxID=2358 RepID=A0A9D6Z238_9BACT|nr:hypothetical protein [Desulfomonile tiedjei]
MSDSLENLFEKAFPFLILAVFLVFGCVGILNHEMWRDELQAWLIVKDSPDLKTVLQTIKFEGHPGLWYSLLYFLSKVSSNIVGFQLLHLAIAAVSIYVFVVFAPFSKFQKSLFAFGYFPLYEYSIISRHYAIGILFVFLLCALYPNRRKMYVVIGVILALLANSNVYGSIIAICFYSMLIVDFFLQADRMKGEKLGAIAGSVAFMLGLALAVEQMIPRSDSCFAVPWHFFFHATHFGATLSTVAASYIPLPNIDSIDFWNSNFLAFSPAGEAFMPDISLVLAVCCLVSLYRTPLALWLYLSSTIGVLLFTYLVYFGSLRHHGHLFVILVVCFWIASYYENSTNLDPAESKVSWNQKTGKIFLTLLLCLHFVSGAFAFYTDLRHPFSAGQAVAEFIKEHGLQTAIVAGDGPYVTSVGAYLDKPVYFADRSRFGTFVVFDTQLSRPDCPELMERVKRVAQPLNADVILVLNEEISCQVPGTAILRLMQITDTIVSDERAYVYLLKKNNK